MSDDHEDSLVAQQVRELEARLVAAGSITGQEIDQAIDSYLTDQGSVTNGARLVAQAWTDPEFRDGLLADGNTATREAGIDWAGHEPIFQVVANGPSLHHLVVCTLCSCYPVGLLGPSPYWYRSLEYRARAVREPRRVLQEFGVILDTDVTINVWDASAETRYMVLPEQPSGSPSRSRQELSELVTIRGLIGTALV